MNEEQQRLWSLLQDALPNVATQMRGSLSNLYTAVGRLLPPEELEQRPELTQSAAILNQSYYRLMRMVNNLSALAILKEQTPFRTANVELVGWLDELVLQAQPLAEMKGVNLRFSAPLRHHVAAVHREYLERMVWNLLSNALKFTPEGGRVTVGLRTAAGQVLIEVQDTGCGLPQEVEELVFDRCLQPELLDPPPHGLGLGLPLCMYIAQGHGGRLLLHAESGRGTTAVAALPDRRTDQLIVEELPFQYAGGFQKVLVELSDALPYRAFEHKQLD